MAPQEKPTKTYIYFLIFKFLQCSGYILLFHL